MSARTACSWIVFLMVFIVGQVAFAQPPEPDPTKVFVVVDQPPNYPEGIAREMAERLTKEGFAGLAPVAAKNPATVFDDAQAAAAGTILHVRMLGRELALKPAASSEAQLAVNYTVYEPEPPPKPGAKPAKQKGNGWRTYASGPLVAKGFITPAGGISEYELISQQLAMVLIRRLLPYKILGAKPAPNGRGVQINMAVENRLRRPLAGFRVMAPADVIAAAGNANVALAPGEKKTVSVFLIYSGPPNALAWKQAQISEIQFAEAAK